MHWESPRRACDAQRECTLGTERVGRECAAWTDERVNLIEHAAQEFTEGKESLPD